MERCPKCSVETQKKHFTAHLRNVHHLSPEEIKLLRAQMKQAEAEKGGKITFVCEEYDSVFTTKRGLKIHKDSKHPSDVEGEVEEVVQPTCCLCDSSFTAQKELAEHCKQAHFDDGAEGTPQDYTVHDVTFSNSEEYKVRVIFHYYFFFFFKI